MEEVVKGYPYNLSRHVFGEDLEYACDEEELIKVVDGIFLEIKSLKSENDWINKEYRKLMQLSEDDVVTEENVDRFTVTKIASLNFLTREEVVEAILTLSQKAILAEEFFKFNKTQEQIAKERLLSQETVKSEIITFVNRIRNPKYSKRLANLLKKTKEEN